MTTIATMRVPALAHAPIPRVPRAPDIRDAPALVRDRAAVRRARVPRLRVAPLAAAAAVEPAVPAVAAVRVARRAPPAVPGVSRPVPVPDVPARVRDAAAVRGARVPCLRVPAVAPAAARVPPGAPAVAGVRVAALGYAAVPGVT